MQSATATTDNELNISVESLIIPITLFDIYRLILIFSTNADSSSDRLVSLFLPAKSAYGSRSQCTTEPETTLLS